MPRVCFLARIRPDRLDEMSPFFADIGGRRPDEAFTQLPEIFHLD
jgi:hypothetical protein